MRTTTRRTLLAAPLLLLAPAGQAAAAPRPVKTPAMVRGRPAPSKARPAPGPAVRHRVVCLGNSTTADAVDVAGQARSDWPRTATQRSGGAIEFVQSGVPRDTAPMMAARWQDDVLAWKPQSVIINAGSVELQDLDHDLDALVAEVFGLVAAARRARIRPLVAGIVPMGLVVATGKDHASRVVAFNQRLGTRCVSDGVTVVNFHTPLADARGGWVPKYARRHRTSAAAASRGVDEIHPSFDGRSVMADRALSVMRAIVR